MQLLYFVRCPCFLVAQDAPLSLGWNTSQFYNNLIYQ
jgi:hypothetical protein